MSYQAFIGPYDETEYKVPQQETQSKQLVDKNVKSEDNNSGKPLACTIILKRRNYSAAAHAYLYSACIYTVPLYGTIQATMVTSQDIQSPVQERETAMSNDKSSKNSACTMV